MNSIVILGNLTGDPEIVNVGDNQVAKFSVAWNNPYVKDKDSPKKVSFFNCELWGKGAEVFTKYHKKGSKTLVQGTLIQDRWKDGDQSRSTVKIKVDRFNFVGGLKKENVENGPGQTDDPPISDDEIPF